MPDEALGVPVGISVGHHTEPFEASVALAERFEQLGMDFVSAGDSGAETFSMLAGVAARTTTLGLMSGIATWSRSPVTMAHAAKTVDNLSAGRYRLGIGPMPRLWAESWHGLQFDPVVGRMREYLTAVRACLDATTENPTAQQGEFFSTVGFAGNRTTPERRVPMMLAATLPQMVRLAAELTDGPMLNSIHPYEWLIGPGAGLIDEGLQRSGRTRADIEIGLMRFCAVDPDRRIAYDHVRRSIAFYFRIPYLRTLLEPFGFDQELAAGEAAVAAGDEAAAHAAVSDRMVDAIGIAGTPAEVLARIQAYGKHVDWLQLVGAFNVPRETAHEQSLQLAELAGRARSLARNGVTAVASRRREAITIHTGSPETRGYVGPAGAQVHYRETGSGDAIVLLHQTASSSAMWQRVMAAFPSGHRLIALDTPGFGESDPLPRSPTIASYVERLRGALADLGVERATVVGHHTGAVLAGELAAQSGGFTDGLVLLGPVVVADDAETEQWLAWIKHWQIDGRGDYVIDRIVPRLQLTVSPEDPVQMQSELIAYLQAGAEYTQAYEAVWHYRAGPRLATVKTPTLCVVGAEEMVDSHVWAARAVEVLPDAELVSIPGGTSELAFEQPAVVADLIHRFATRDR